MEYKLIEAVKMYPCLYDKSKPEYRSKTKKENSWASIASTTGATVQQCQGRWRSLRDRYVREISSENENLESGLKEKRKWCYMDALSFLQKHVGPRRKFSNMQWDSAEEVTFVKSEVDVLEPSSSCSVNTPSVTSPYFDECANNPAIEEETPEQTLSNMKEWHQLQQRHTKFDMLCGAVTDLISARKNDGDRSRNSDFFRVLDSYLLKHTEEDQDRLKIDILNMVFNYKTS